jgi:hypothetical protein
MSNQDKKTFGSVTPDRAWVIATGRQSAGQPVNPNDIKRWQPRNEVITVNNTARYGKK